MNKNPTPNAGNDKNTGKNADSNLSDAKNAKSAESSGKSQSGESSTEGANPDNGTNSEIGDALTGNKDKAAPSKPTSKGVDRFEDAKSLANDMKSGDVKGAAIKHATAKATEAAPEGVQKAAEVAGKVSNAASTVTTTIAAVKSGVASAAAVLANPVTWIVVLVVFIVFEYSLIIVSGAQTLGRNENADGCYGVGGNAASVFVADDSADWATRANGMGSWLMSTPFEFLGGKPMTKKQAAGVMGNYISESQVTFAQAEAKGENSDGSLNKATNEEVEVWTQEGTEITDGRGLALAQWSWSPSRAQTLIDRARSMGKNWYDADVQLALMQTELNNSYGKILNDNGFSDDSKTVEELTTIFHNIYEGSADKNMDKRHKAANDFLEVFTGGNSGGGSGGSCLTSASNVDTSSVVGLAISISYGTTPESKVSSGDSYGRNRAKQEYKDAKASAMQISKDHLAELYASCDRFVATVIKLTLDPEIPWGSTIDQQTYLSGSPKWEQYTTKSEAKPGDVWITKTRGHVVLYIGDHNGVDSIAHASYMDRVAGIGSAAYLSENLVDLNGRAYYGYRFVG